MISVSRLVVSFLACCLLASCSTYSSGTEKGTGQGANPTFSGPHADQMTRDYQDSNSDYFHQVIADGLVTEAEFHEGNERYAGCLRDKGFMNVEFHSDGTSSFDDRTDISDQEERQIADDCSLETGHSFVSMWYYTLAANPDNVDWPSAERDCLVKAGLLEPGTTVEQMNQWYEDEGKGSDSRQALVCSQDALGKLGLK